MQRVTLSLRDLPQELTVAELGVYLQETYPSSSITITKLTRTETTQAPAPVSPRRRVANEIDPDRSELIGQLPPELLSKIARAGPGAEYGSHMITKDVGTYSRANVIEAECARPITEREILKEIELKTPGLLVMTQTSDPDGNIELYISASWNLSSRKNKQLQSGLNGAGIEYEYLDALGRF